MSYLFPRFAYAPAVRCAAPTFRHEFAPLFSLFDDSLRELNAISHAARKHTQSFNPRFNVKENKENYLLEGEVPGFKGSDISIEWHNDTLAISGRHETVKESGSRVAALDAQPEAQTIENTAAPESNTTKRHQATVEDEEHPANASAAVAEANSQEAEKATQSDDTNNDVAPTIQEPNTQHWISERSTGQFLRQFSFPSNAVNQEAIKASLESGILKIVVPKNAQQPAKKINIE